MKCNSTTLQDKHTYLYVYPVLKNHKLFGQCSKKWTILNQQPEKSKQELLLL